MLADTHSHTCFSDGADSPQAMVEVAERAGLDLLCITDHLTLPVWLDPRAECSVAEKDLPLWRQEITEAAARVSIPVLWGAECDWYEGCEPLIERWSQEVQIRLGSVHWVDGRPIDDPEDLSFWEDEGPDTVWQRYVEAWCAACESTADFDTMAHPDLPARFWHEGYAPSIDLEPLYKTMAECAHDTHRRVEVSTALLRKGGKRLYPDTPLLKHFSDAQVPVTFGSDAHRARDVGADLTEAHRVAWDLGYRFQEVPSTEGWRSVAL